MTIYLKQSTASQEIPLGVFVDSTDGNTAETGLTIANTDIQLWKSGATTLANKNSGGATHISGGIYYAVLDATDTNTLGPLVIFVHVAGALAVRLECVVLAANVYDSMIAGSDALQVHANEITAGLITAAAIATDAIDADAIKADAVTEIQNGLATSAALATVDTNVDAILVDTNELQTDLVDGGRLDLLIDAILADTNELQGDWVNGGRLDLLVDAILEDTGTTLPASISGLNNLSAADVNAQLVDVVGTDAIEGTLTQRDILRVLLAFVAGTTTGGNTTSVTFKSQDGNTNRIVMTVDSDGDRSAVTVDGA